MGRPKNNVLFRRWAAGCVIFGSMLLTYAAVFRTWHEMSWARGIEPALTRRMSLSLEKASLEAAYAEIERISGFQVVGVVPMERNVSLSAKDIPLDQVLDIVA